MPPAAAAAAAAAPLGADVGEELGEELGEEVGVPAAWWHQHLTARIAAAAPRRRGARISKLLLAGTSKRLPGLLKRLHK